MNLYRIHRPQSFQDIVDQEYTKAILQESIRSDQVSHAYLFSGPRGTGKTSTARIMAKAVNCSDRAENGEPCNKCSICSQISEGNLTDLIEIDAASNRGIDEIRSLRENVNFMPTQAGKKVYIIDEVHMLTKEAFNALLKTLEEPPAHVMFILATTEAHKIPETIISRCQHFHFKRIREQSIADRLADIAKKEKITLDSEVFTLLAKSVNGGMRDAISLLDQIRTSNSNSLEAIREEIGIVDSSRLEELWNSLRQKNAAKALETIDWLYHNGYDLEQSCLHWLLFLRQKMLEHLDQAEELAASIEYIEAFDKARIKIKSASIPQLPLEIAILKVCSGVAQTTKQPVTAKKAVTPPVPKKIEPEAPVESVACETPVEKAVVQTAQTASGDLQNLRNAWSNVIPLIPTAFVKLSVKDAQLLSIEDGTLTMGVTTEFLLNKLENNSAKQEIMEAVFQETGQRLALTFQLVEAETKPDVLETTETPAAPVPTEKIEYNQLQETIQDVFTD